MRKILSRIAIYISIYFLFPLGLFCQTLYSNYNNTGRTFINKYDLATCSDELLLEIPNLQAYDIAVHPDGSFYLITVGKLVHVKLNLGIVNEIMIPNNGIYNGLVCDIEGNLYLLNKRLEKYNTKTGKFTYLGLLPDDYYCTGDVTVRDGEYYLSASNNKYLHSAIIKLDITDASKSQILYTGGQYFFMLWRLSMKDAVNQVLMVGAEVISYMK